jgi:hypothetical protein
MEIDMTLADRYAILKSDIDALTEELNRVKAEIKATGMETIVGEHAIVVVGLSERSTLDTKAAKEFLTADQITACTKVTLVETLRVKPKVATLIG